MGTTDLNKIAIAMGKLIKMISEIEPKIKDEYDVYLNREHFFALAYICRVGVIDRVERNSWITMDTPIRIPTGIISSRKENIKSGFRLTLGRLMIIVSKDPQTEYLIEEIIEKGAFYYEFENKLPLGLKDKI